MDLVEFGKAIVNNSKKDLKDKLSFYRMRVKEVSDDNTRLLDILNNQHIYRKQVADNMELIIKLQMIVHLLEVTLNGMDKSSSP